MLYHIGHYDSHDIDDKMELGFSNKYLHTLFGSNIRQLKSYGGALPPPPLPPRGLYAYVQ